MASSTHSTPKKNWRERFLKKLAERANVSEAAKCAGIDRTLPYKVRESDADFAAAWEGAEQQAIDKLEKAAFQRAAKQSDVLLIFLLKAHRREKYGERISVTVLQKVQREVEQMGNDDLLAVLGYDLAGQPALADGSADSED